MTADSRVDLHLHTTASDGQYTLAEVVSFARAQGLDIIAITDHDTSNGIAEARQAAQGSPVVVPGIELSAVDSQGDVHILGYLFDLEDASFQEDLTRFREGRLQRAQKILQRLTELRMPLEWARVEALANDAAIGRPHIARAMVEAGYVSSIKEAFERYIHQGGPAYVARKRLSPEEAIARIHRAGGVVVMAHPALVTNYDAMIERLIPAGLDGIEVVHPKNPEPVREHLRQIAEAHRLIMTGGSDFHRPEPDGTLLIGSLTPPEGCVEALRERAAHYARAKPG